jgi:Fe-S-cluster containining protein
MNPDQPISLNPFSTLQQNASELFEQIQKRHGSKMQCQSGCSKCCYADFSVFVGEALIINHWFRGLSELDRIALLATWLKPVQAGACAFLRADQCSIYEARPMICRTQGAPLRFSIEKKKEVTQTLDCCPLNFEAGQQIPKTPTDWFDLDRLTSLQAIAENYTLKNFEIMPELKALIDKDGRIPLKSLQAYLAQSEFKS